MSNTRRAAAKPPDPFQCCMRLLDSVDLSKMATQVLTETIEDISANFEITSQSRAVCKNLEKVKDALGVIHRTVDAAVTGVAPESSDVRYTHSALRSENKRKATKELLRSEPLKKTRTSKPFKQLDNMIRSNPKTPSVPRRPQSSRLATKVVTPHVRIPVPADGVLFEVLEAMNALDTCPDRQMKCWCLHWIEKRYVPVSYQQVLKKFKKFKAGEYVQPDWFHDGRPMAVDPERLNKKVVERLQVQGQAVGPKMIAELVSDTQKDELIENGFVPLGNSATVSDRTLVRYSTRARVEAVQSAEDVRVTQFALKKTNSRITRESSLRSMDAYKSVIGATHYRVCPPFANTARIEDATEGAKWFYEAVKEAHGGLDISPVLPGLITSTDDSTLYHCVEEKNDVAEWVLVKGDTGARGTFTYEKDEKFKGIKARLRVTIAADGTIAPVCIYLTGLAEKLSRSKCPSGIYEIPIKGLTYSGAIDPWDESLGYVVCLRHDAEFESVEKRAAAHYHTTKLRPFIERQRVLLGWEAGTEIPEALTSVSWCDGGQAQLAAITEEEIQQRDSELKMETCKHSSARSTIEQPCDAGTGFKNTKRNSKKLTSKNQPMSGYKARVHSQFDQIRSEEILVVSPSEHRALKDFVCVAPTILSKSFTQDVIHRSFVLPGMIDENTSSFPDGDKLMATIRRPVTVEEHRLVVASQVGNVKCVLDHGHVTDEEFTRLGYPIDIDVFEKEYPCDSGITNESYQRAKQLSHVRQREMRRKNIDKQIAEKQRAIILKQQKGSTILAGNAECEKKLLLVMKTRLQSETELPPEAIRQAQLADFDKCTVPFLKAFIHVRKFDSISIPSEAKWSWPKKDNLANASRGEDCLILRAFDLRTNDIRLVLIDPATIQMTTAATAPPPTTALTAEQQVPPASTFLDDISWVRRVSGAFVGGNNFILQTTDVHKQEANALYKIMKERFSSLLSSRLLDRRQHSHQCVVFFRQNLSRMAAILVLARQVQDDLATTTKDDTLLREPEGYFIRAIGEAANLQGNYLYVDIRRSRHVRAGKAVGLNRRTGDMRTFGKRDKEHLKSSLNDNSGSCFYMSYPNRDSTVPVSDMIRRGYFQDLVQYVGLGFDRTQEGVVEKLCSPDPSKGIFHWSDSTRDLVRRTNFKDSDVLEDKQLHFVGYMTETSHGLMICESHNVSKSFGFELPMGIFPK